MRTVILLCLVAIACALLPGWTEALTYERSLALHGEPWRMLTGHLVHDSLRHLGYDLLAILALGFACERLQRGAAPRAIALATLALSFLLLPLSPGVDRYRGASALATALYACTLGTLLLAARRDGDSRRAAVAVLLLAGFAVKTGVEIATGTPLFARDPSITPWPLAHAVGAVAGLVAAWLAARAEPRGPEAKRTKPVVAARSPLHPEYSP